MTHRADQPGGGPAFPSTHPDYVGMQLRDYLAAHAPVSLEDAVMVCGYIGHKEALFPDERRAIVLSVLVTLRYAYADEMLRCRGGKP